MPKKVEDRFVEMPKIRAISKSLLKSKDTFTLEPDKIGNPQLEDPLYKKWKKENKIFNVEMSPFHQGFKRIVHYGLNQFGYDVESVNLKESPLRSALGMRELLWSKFSVAAEIRRILKTNFPSDLGLAGKEISYTGMVVMTDAAIFSFCPHHAAMWQGRVHVAYIPGPSGKVVGISKLHRLVSTLAKQMIMQESYTELLTAILMAELDIDGAAAIVQGSHACMCTRGTRALGTSITTSSMRGAFYHNPETRAELMFHTQQSNMAPRFGS